MDELIQSYVDRAKFTTDTDFIISELKRAGDAYDSLSKAKTNLKPDKPLTDISASIRQAEKDTQNLIKSQGQLQAANERAAISAAKLATEQAKADAIRNKSLIDQERELDRLIALEEKQNKANSIEALKAKSALEKQAATDSVNAGRERILQLRAEQEQIEKLAELERQRTVSEQQHLSGTFNPGGGKSATAVDTPLNLSVAQGNILLLKQYEAEIVKLTTEQKLSVEAFKKGEISQSAFKKTIVESSEKISGYKRAVADLNTEMKLAANVNDAERNSLARAQALIAQYTFEKKKLNLATQEGVLMNNNYNKAIAASNAFILKNADAETVRTKSVGQYTQGIQKAFSGLRTLANILPGIGLSGLFLAAFEGIKLALEALGLFSNKLSDTARQRELLLAVEKESSEAYGKEAGQLRVLRAEIESNAVPMASRLQAIKDIKEQYPDYFKGLTNEQILTGNVADAYDLAAAAILRKAKASAAASAIEKNAAKELLILQEEERDVIDTNIKLRTKEGNTTVDEFGNIIDVTQQTNTLLKESFKTRQKDRHEERVQIKKDNDFLLGIAVDGAKETIKIDKQKTSSKKDSLQELKASLKTEFDIYKVSQEAKIRGYDSDIKSDKVHYLDKLVALDNFVKAQKELLDKQEAFDIATKKAETARNIQHLEEGKAGKSGAEQARINENIKIEEQNLQQAILLIEAQANDKSIQLLESAGKTRQGIIDEQNKKELESYQEYLDEKALLETDAAGDKRIQEAFKKRLAQEKEFAAKSLELQKQINEKKVELATKAEDFLFSLGTASAERQLNNITDQKNAVDAQTAAALKANDAKVQSEEQKAANIIIINARAQAQQAALDKKANDIKNKQAQFERAQQIFEIGITSLKAIFAIKAQAAILAANPVTAVLAAKALAEIPLVLAGAALAIGALLAKPIPKLKGGKGAYDNYEGHAIVNDGSTLEAIQRADGSIEFPKGRNVLTYVGKNDIVHPDKDAWLNAILNAAHRDANNGMRFTAPKGKNEVVAALEKQNILLNKIANKRENHIDAKAGALVSVWNFGAQQTKYLQENTNW